MSKEILLFEVNIHIKKPKMMSCLGRNIKTSWFIDVVESVNLEKDKCDLVFLFCEKIIAH